MLSLGMGVAWGEGKEAIVPSHFCEFESSLGWEFTLLFWAGICLSGGKKNCI